MNSSDIFFLSNELSRLEKLVEGLLEPSNFLDYFLRPYDEEAGVGICNDLSQYEYIDDLPYNVIKTPEVIE